MPLDRVPFELPALAQGAFFRASGIGTGSCILLIFQDIISRIPSHFSA